MSSENSEGEEGGGGLFHPSYSYHGYSSYKLNTQILVAAVAVLILVIIFILALHVYARFFWRPYDEGFGGRRRRRRGATGGSRRSHALQFSEEQEMGAGAGTGYYYYYSVASRGLEKAAIEALPVFQYSSSMRRREGDVAECAVCLSEFEEKESGRLLPMCNHRFHTDCIDMWFFSHSNCPLCRAIVRPPPSLDGTSPLPLLPRSSSSDHSHHSATVEIAPTGEDLVVAATPSTPPTALAATIEDHPKVPPSSSSSSSAAFMLSSSFSSSSSSSLSSLPSSSSSSSLLFASSSSSSLLSSPSSSLLPLLLSSSSSSSPLSTHNGDISSANVGDKSPPPFIAPRALNSFKRLLSRERKVHGYDCEGGSVSSSDHRLDNLQS